MEAGGGVRQAVHPAVGVVPVAVVADAPGPAGGDSRGGASGAVADEAAVAAAGGADDPLAGPGHQPLPGEREAFADAGGPQPRGGDHGDREAVAPGRQLGPAGRAPVEADLAEAAGGDRPEPPGPQSPPGRGGEHVHLAPGQPPVGTEAQFDAVPVAVAVRIEGGPLRGLGGGAGQPRGPKGVAARAGLVEGEEPECVAAGPWGDVADPAGADPAVTERVVDPGGAAAGLGRPDQQGAAEQAGSSGGVVRSRMRAAPAGRDLVRTYLDTVP